MLRFQLQFHSRPARFQGREMKTVKWWCAARLSRAVWVALLPTLASFSPTGLPVESLSELDSLMQQALVRYAVKGGALAITKEGHLVFARGYGVADAEGDLPVEPDSVFRWCSISKTLTAAAVMNLAEREQLDLDRPIFDILDDFAPYNGVWGDNRLRRITVRQVLNHRADGTGLSVRSSTRSWVRAA